MNPYVVGAAEIHAAMAALTKLPTPPAERLTRETGPVFLAQHNGCPQCAGEDGTPGLPWNECDAFTPARMRGIGHTFWVIDLALTEAGAYVLDESDGGPPGSQTADKYGPFADYPAALEWAARVAVAETRREFGITP